MDAAPAGADSRAGAGAPLDHDEVTRRIRQAGWAVLAVVEGTRPYAVPMAYGYDGQRFFVASGPGRKRRALENAPLVCLTIVDPPPEADRRGYVVVLGRARPVHSLPARLRAGLLILRRFSRGGLPSLRDLGRMARGHIFRIDPHEIAGRVLPS